MLNWIQRKWDWWIYCRFFHSSTRICKRMPGWSRVMELHLRDYNALKLTDEERNRGEQFYNLAYQKTAKQGPLPKGTLK